MLDRWGTRECAAPHSLLRLWNDSHDCGAVLNPCARTRIECLRRHEAAVGHRDGLLSRRAAPVGQPSLHHGSHCAVQRASQIPSLDDPLHELKRVESRALVFERRRHSFTAPLSARGFTLSLQRQLHLIDGHLVPGPVVTHGRFALLSVWPFADDAWSQRMSARRRLLWPLLLLTPPRRTTRRLPFRSEVRSPQRGKTHRLSLHERRIYGTAL